MYFSGVGRILIFQSALLGLVFSPLALYPQSCDVRMVRHWSLYCTDTRGFNEEDKRETKKNGQPFNLNTCLFVTLCELTRICMLTDSTM
jgi:hypothetical protein